MARTKYTPRMDKYNPGLILSPPLILPDFTTAWCLTYPVSTYTHSTQGARSSPQTCDDR